MRIREKPGLNLKKRGQQQSTKDKKGHGKSPTWFSCFSTPLIIIPVKKKKQEENSNKFLKRRIYSTKRKTQIIFIITNLKCFRNCRSTKPDLPWTKPINIIQRIQRKLTFFLKKWVFLSYKDTFCESGMHYQSCNKRFYYTGKKAKT